MMVKRVPIDTYCEKKIPTLQKTYDGLIDYVDISSVDNAEKKIISYQTIDANDAPSRAKQLLKQGDVLVSTVRPNLNAVAVVEEETENLMVGSTGYCVLRCKETMDVRYLFNFCQSQYFVDDMSSQATGASYPAVSNGIVRSSLIPCYSIEEQKDIAEKMDTVSELLALRKQQLAELDELTKARFVELFGDPISNPHGFDNVSLAELADIKIGPFGSLLHKEDYIEGGHALVNPSHIISGKVVPDNKLTVSPEKYEELSAYHLKAGDVVMGRRGEMGRCAVVPCDGYLCGTGSLMIRTKGEVTADYIQKIISFPSFKKTIEDMAVGQTMPNLNVPIVSNFQIIKPPIEVQQSYYAFVEQTDKSKSAVQQSIAELEELKKSLMQKYFG